ncbi:MAG: extracellular solute-binding protein [Armatimonadaceae bacterium]
MTRRSILAALCGLVSVATLPLLAGCSNQQGADSGAGAGTTGAPSSGKKLTIAWAEWDPAKQMETLVKNFTQETGIEVEVQQIPWSDFETKINTAWSAQDPTYDLIIGDSQWLGKAATAGHYVELSDWAKTNVPMDQIAPAALKNYGEYPAGSGKLYALPCMSDGIAFAYRKDLFEDPKNMADFKAKYGRDLAPPKTWDEFRDVAEFFTKADGSLYGSALFFAKEYDGATMGFDQVLWAYGGDLSRDGKATGVINGPEALKALQFYADLKKFCPPGSETYYFNETNRDFMAGKVAMAENWVAFFPDLISDKNQFKDKTGFFVVPEGPAGRFVSLGGQGISVSSYSKNPEEAKQFIAWFQKEDTQKKWASMGGLTANTAVAATDEFKNARPYNAVFGETVNHLKDFYNNPRYTELLTPMQNNLNEVFAGAKQPKEALDTIATEHQKVLDELPGS